MSKRCSLAYSLLFTLVLGWPPIGFCEPQAEKTVTRSHLGSVSVDHYQGVVTFQEVADDGKSYRADIAISKPWGTAPIKANRIDVWLLAQGGRALPGRDALVTPGRASDVLVEVGSRGATASAIYLFDRTVPREELTAFVVAIDGIPTALKLPAATLAVRVPPEPRNLPVGKWKVEFSNGVSQCCEINADGIASVVEPARASGGKSTMAEKPCLISYDDQRLERWTAIGAGFVVEHWFPSSSFPAGTPVLGIAERILP